MRILYGVVGEGMGHAIRSRVILDELVKKHEVQVVVSGRAADYLEKRASSRLQVKKIWGLTIVTEDNAVRSFKTVLQNLKGAAKGWPKNIKAWFDIAREFDPDVVISDFESWSYLFAKNHRKPVISIDNMQIINRCKHEKSITKGHRAEFETARSLVKSKVPGAYHYLISTFFYPPIRKKRTTLHPPILRPEILAAKPEPEKHLLVYQTYTTNLELPEMLKTTGVECRVYGLKRELKTEERDGNIVYKPFSETGFVEDLRTARGVISSGGFTLMGEAVYLRKPMLSVPVEKQFEQILNARYLEAEGYGICVEELKKKRLGEFLERIPDLEKGLKRYAQNGNKQLLEKLAEALDGAASGEPLDEYDDDATQA